MNLKFYNKMAYENKSNWTLGENKPNSNPIKPNFRKAQMNVKSVITMDYRKNDDFSVRKNKPKQSQGIKRVRSIFRRFILALLTQALHINASVPIISLKKRFAPKIEKNLKNSNFFTHIY